MTAVLEYVDSESDIATIVENAQQIRNAPMARQDAYIVTIFPSILDVPGDDISPVMKYIGKDLPDSVDALVAEAGMTLPEFGDVIFYALSDEERQYYLSQKNPGYPAWEHAYCTLLAAITELVSNAAEHGNHFDPSKNVRVDLSILSLENGIRRFAVEVADEGGFHDYKRHKRQDYVRDKEVDIRVRGHGDSIVQKIRWTKGAVMNFRGKTPYTSSVLYYLNF
jgi:hypothetical protein